MCIRDSHPTALTCRTPIPRRPFRGRSRPWGRTAGGGRGMGRAQSQSDRRRMEPARMRNTSTSIAQTHGRRLLTGALVAGVVMATVAGAVLTSGKKADAAGSAYLPAAGHVFVINLENKGYDQTWGPGSAAPYLSTTLRSKGVLLNQYFGTAHNSLPNYISQISGQGPNPQTQGDCQTYSPFVGAQTAPPGQAVGDGCVYPASVPTLAGQLTSSGLTWKGYMEDMGTPCRHPALGAVDDTQKAKVGDQYAARHNPFVYFAAITGSAECAQRDVDLSQLPTDLASTSSTPTLSYITPN